MLMIIFESMKFVLMIIPVLISVAYLTLAESKMLGYSQNSKGPNVVGIYGLLQPLADGIKLFSKEMIIPNHVSMFLYFFSPILALSLSLLIWIMFPFGKSNLISDLNLSLLFFLAISSISVYAMLISGWSSNSKYAFLGSLSAAAQMISYEVSMGLILFSMMLLSGSLNLTSIINSQFQSMSFFIPLWPVALMFLVSCLAETNSAPFDLTEGESEIVSGYNVEYSSMSFALFFLAEYSHIIFMSMIFIVLFWGGGKILFFYKDFLLFMKSFFFLFFFIWVSTSFPSMSYDQLMALIWKNYLPLSMSFMMLINSILWGFLSLPPKLWI